MTSSVYPKACLILAVTSPLYHNFDITTKFLQTSGQKASGLSIVHANYCYHDSYQETVLVDNDMPFDALHLLVAVNLVEGTVVAPANALLSMVPTVASAF